MKGNFIAKNMNTVNRNSVHRSLKDYARDYKDELEEEYSLQVVQVFKVLSPSLLELH